MNDDRYNGWANRETWLINLWYAPSSRNDVLAIRADLEEQLDAMPNGALRDMINFMAIDWAELEDAAAEDEQE